MSGEPTEHDNKDDDVIKCKVCGEQFIRKEWRQHKYEPKHIEAQKKEGKGMITCKDCGIPYVRGCWKVHVKDEKHQKAVVEKQKLKNKHEDDVLVCKFCNQEYIRKNFEEHKRTQKHREAHQQRYGDCDVCKERYVKKHWKEHTKSEKHKLFERKRQNKKVENVTERRERDKYKMRQGSGENQEYITALGAFFLLRYTFECKDFKLSVFNDEWEQFGDIVIEDDTQIEAICCKKIQSKNNYSLSVLAAESGKLSIRERSKIFEILKTRKDFSKTSFSLHTVSNLSIEGNCQFVYDDAIVANWKEDVKKVWKGRKVEIEQKKGYKKRDLLNTTNDSEDIFVVKVTDSKFQMYTNQKQEMELKSAIHSMLENKFGTVKNVSDLVVKYVKEFFNPKKATNHKMTRDDVLGKIAELLLVPYWVLPDGIILEKEVNLWHRTLKNFDFVVMKNNCEVMRKLYGSINHIFKEETKDVFSTDGSARFVYLTLWKKGLVPLILTPQNEDQLTLILKVIGFLKSEFPTCLRFIILTDMKVDYPDELDAFVTGEDLRSLDNNDFREVLTETKINFLNFDITLKEIVSCNADFLEKLTPDTLLNMFLGEFSFKGVQIPGSEEAVEYTLVLETETMKSAENYFQGRDYDVVEQLEELSYLIAVEGKPTLVRVPPEI